MNKSKKPRRTKSKNSSTTKTPPPAKVISLAQVRESRRKDERRRVQRTMLKDFVQVFFTNGNDEHLYPVEIIEASAEGCSFKTTYDSFQGNETRFRGPLSLRLYLSRDTYMMIGVDIINSTPLVEEGGKFVRFGCKIDRSFSSYAAYKHLLQFIEALGAVSKFEPQFYASGA